MVAFVQPEVRVSGKEEFFQVDQSHMRPLDRILQAWRMRKANRFIRDGDRLLDVGCFDGVLLKHFKPRLQLAVGLDPLVSDFKTPDFEVYNGTFPGKVRFADNAFSCITMLAVLEHVADVNDVATESYRVLGSGGRVIVTVPHPYVDTILDVLVRFKVLGGMSLDEHHRFDARDVVPAFENQGFKTLAQSSFQLGLNRLFVFQT
jgi:SAM-dependent methyltransferase